MANCRCVMRFHSFKLPPGPPVVPQETPRIYDLPLCDCRRPKAVRGSGEGTWDYMRCAGCSGRVPYYWVVEGRAQLVDPPKPGPSPFDWRRR